MLAFGEVGVMLQSGEDPCLEILGLFEKSTLLLSGRLAKVNTSFISSKVDGVMLLRSPPTL